MLVPNWRAVLLRAWSVWVLLFVFVISAAEVLLPFFADRFSHLGFAALTGLAAVVGIIARVWAQNSLGKKQ